MTRGRTAMLAAVAAVAALGAGSHAWAQPKDDDDDVTVTDDEARPTRRKARPPAEAADGDEVKKQDLSGHDLGTDKKQNVFERDRFFVDKTDTAKTEKGTLIQGSITSTTFGYHEQGGTLIPPVDMGAPVPSASQFNRLFTELRLQTDFRHIAATRWDARIDVRGRVVNSPGVSTAQPFTPATTGSVQSGFLGDEELEIKELWILRNGARSDIFFGRQFIADLGAVRIDGLRVDYASSSKFTLLGFAGLYPIRGSRSITTDYSALRSNPAADGTRSDAGQFTGAGGFGAAYRTLDAYGSFGGVALVPLSSEGPRVFGTSSGYWRRGTKLDFYHLAVIDVVGSNAVNAGLTNLSLGVNYKPDQRLRGTLSLHRVDTETLTVQAQAFLADPDPGVNLIQNEAYLVRIASNEARGSLSAGLGQLQRFELTAAITYRNRGEVTLSAPPQMGNAPPVTTTLGAAHSVEVYGAITDRRSVADLRLGVDGSRVFGAGSTTYHHTESTSLRAFAARELANGHGEWEAEIAYSTSSDDNAGTACVEITTCYGSARSTLLSLGGNLYYRINRDWFALGSVFLNRNAITHVEAAMATEDPPVTGISGYFRIAYRF